MAASFGNKVFPCRALAGEMDSSKVIKQSRAGVQIERVQQYIYVLMVTLSGAPTWAYKGVPDYYHQLSDINCNQTSQ